MYRLRLETLTSPFEGSLFGLVNFSYTVYNKVNYQ